MCLAMRRYDIFTFQLFEKKKDFRFEMRQSKLLAKDAGRDLSMNLLYNLISQEKKKKTAPKVVKATRHNLKGNND